MRENNVTPSVMELIIDVTKPNDVTLGRAVISHAINHYNFPLPL